MNSKRTRFTSPFAPLQLFESDSKALEQLSSALLSNYMEQYDQFCLRGGRTGVDERIWKPIKQRKNIGVFVQRKNQSDGGAMDEIRESIDSFADCGVLQPSDLPVVLTVTSIAGTLDDHMYGLMCPTVEVMRVKTSYTDDKFADAAVLHTIVVPTQEDPFQSIVIKWAQSGMNFLQRSILSYRDFVYLERTGTIQSASGERLGFHLLHSVHFPQTHELPSIKRGNISVCGIARDNKERNQVEVYVQCILDPGGRSPRSLFLQVAAAMLVALSKNIECSYRKKLMWRLTKKKRIDGNNHKQPSSSDKLDSCTTCKRLPSKVTRVLGYSRSRRCALCAKYVCPSCRVKKTLSHVTSGTGKLWQREFVFCAGCYSEVCQSDAFTAALEEFVMLETNKEGADEAFGFREDLYSFTSSSESSRSVSTLKGPQLAHSLLFQSCTHPAAACCEHLPPTPTHEDAVWVSAHPRPI